MFLYLFCRTDSVLLGFRCTAILYGVTSFWRTGGWALRKIFLHCRSFILCSEGDLFSSTLNCIFFSHFIVNASHCTPIMISVLCERFKTSDSVLSVSIFICLSQFFLTEASCYNVWEDKESIKSVWYSFSEVKNHNIKWLIKIRKWVNQN